MPLPPRSDDIALPADGSCTSGTGQSSVRWRRYMRRRRFLLPLRPGRPLRRLPHRQHLRPPFHCLPRRRPPPPTPPKPLRQGLKAVRKMAKGKSQDRSDPLHRRPVTISPLVAFCKPPVLASIIPVLARETFREGKLLHVPRKRKGLLGDPEQDGLLSPVSGSQAERLCKDMSGAVSDRLQSGPAHSVALESGLLTCVRFVYFLACRHYVNAYLLAGLKDVIREDGLSAEDDGQDGVSIRLDEAENGVVTGGGAAAAREDGANSPLLPTSTRKSSAVDMLRRDSHYGRTASSRTYSRLASALFCLAFSESSMLFTLLLFGEAISEE